MMILFDLDDTLYSERQYIYQGFKGVARYLHKKYGLDQRESYYRMIYIFSSGSKLVFDDFLRSAEINGNITDLVDVYRRAPRSLAAYPDVRRALEILKNFGHKLLLITNGRAEVQKQKVEHLELAKYFDELFILDEYGEEYWKPSTLIFRVIKQKYGEGLINYAFVGNSEEDFQFSRSLGIKFIYVERRNQIRKLQLEQTPDKTNIYTIRTLYDLVKMICMKTDLSSC